MKINDNSPCECFDSNCPHCHGKCNATATQKLYRADMTDEWGIHFCEGCADDAWESGVFTDAKILDDLELEAAYHHQSESVFKGE